MKLFLWIFDRLQSRKWLTVTLMVALFAVLGFFGSRIGLEEDIAGFLPQDKRNEKVNYLYANISIADKVIVRFSMPGDGDENAYALMDAAENFAARLDSLCGPEYIKEIMLHVSGEAMAEVPQFITRNMAYFLTAEDYARMDSLLAGADIPAMLAADRQLLLSPIGMGMAGNLTADPLHLSGAVLKRLQNFKVSDQYQTVDGYIFTQEGALMMFIDSANPMSETKLNAHLAKSMEQAANFVPDGVKVDYFGGNLVAVTNASQIKRDSAVSIAIAVVLIVLLLVWYFRSVRSIAMILLPVGFGVVMALACMYLLQDTMSAIALGAGSIIFGIAVDYPMQYLVCRIGSPGPRQTLKDIFMPLTVSNITTVGAFLSLLFISARSMRDFGLMAALVLVGTILFVLVFVPQISGKPKVLPNQARLAGWLNRYKPENYKWLMIGLAIFTAVMMFFSGRISFETDMQKINYMTGDQRRQFAELSDVTVLGEKNLYLVAEGGNLDEALRNYEALTPTLQRFTEEHAGITSAGIGGFLPSEEMQRARIDMWNAFWHGGPSPDRAETLIAAIEKAASGAGFTAGAFGPFAEILRADHAPEPADYFAPLRDNLMKDYIIEKPGRAMVVTLLYAPEDVVPELEQTFENAGGGFLFDSGSMMRDMVRLLAEDFDYVLYICAFIVFAFLLIAFRRFEIGFVAFLPMTVCWVWILGIMYVLGIKFNIVNIVLATFIFGLGDDFNIFITDGLMQRYAYGKKTLENFRVSIVISALMLFIGIGVLVFAKHPAMSSLGEVTVIGMVSVVFAAFTVTPFLFNLMVMQNGRKREYPVTVALLGRSLLALLVLVLGSIVLTAAGFFLLTLGGRTPKHRLRYHRMLCGVSDWVVRNMPGSTHRMEGAVETFEKPAVVVCNHASHLDLMYLLRLTPKMIVLTNKWVWRSPFYCGVIRYADFYPVADEGVDNALGDLKKMVAEGYSIAVFPEGTRSPDGRLGRFHRGAFYLAEQLGLDIVPVVFHGVRGLMPKGDELLRRGSVTTRILPRIAPGEEGYVERSKAVRRLMADNYEQMRRAGENVGYFRWLLLNNYIYKGYKVERAARAELHRTEAIQRIADSLPESGTVLVRNCGIGLVPLAFALVKPDVMFAATDPDADNLALGENCASKPASLTFITEEEAAAGRYDMTIDLDAI